MDNAVLWDNDANPVGIPMHQLVYAMRREDAGAGLLLDAVTMADLMTDPDIEGVVQLDALVVEVSRMSLKMDMLKRVMESAGNAVKPTEVTISDPVRARGVVQVMVLFQMSDGQTISIWFHNPDTTPAKLTPLDELISWKWMLNKKDVTIVVAPERGQELNVREVARRVMRLVERNSDTFKRANEKSAAKVKAVEELKTEIGVLEVELSDWQRKIEIAQMERDEAPTPKERWDSARGHARAVDKAVREEVLNGPQATDMEAFRELTAMLATLRALVAGETAADTPEALRSKVDELAVAIRAKMVEAAKAPAPVAPAATPAPTPAPAPAASDSVLAGLGVSPEDLAAIADDGGYPAVAKDERLALKWQDVLDAAWQQRIVDVRNALGLLGWRRAEGSSELSKDGHALVFVPKMVGAGRNIVAAHWEINGVTGFFMSDVLDRSAQELAERINMGLPQKVAEPAAAVTAEPSEDPAEARGRMIEARVQAVKGELRGLGWSASSDFDPLAKNGAKLEIHVSRDSGNAIGVRYVVTGNRKATATYGADGMVDDMETSPADLAALINSEVGNALVVVEADGRWRVAHALNGNAISPSYPSQEEAQQAADAAMSSGTLDFQAPSDGGPAKIVSPTDAELQAAAESGAEVNRIARNLADPSTKDLPKATLSGGTAETIFLYTDADVARAVKAVHDAEELSNFRPFDLNALKMPTAVQLGLSKINTMVLPVSEKDPSVVLDGWSNGHMLDLTQRPKMVQKAIEQYFVDTTSPFIRKIPQPTIEKLETAAKSRGTQVEPIAHYDYTQTVTDSTKAKKGKAFAEVPVNSIVFAAPQGDAWVWLDAKYVAYFVKTYKGCDFFADSPEASVAVRHHGKLVGIVMPMNSKGDTSVIARAKRVSAKAQAAQEPEGTLTPAAVDAAYQFAEATEAFKLAVAHSVTETEYSAFLTARTIDERAKAMGLTVGWDVQVVMLDSIPLFGGTEADDAFGSRRERVLDSLVDAARPYLPAGAVLDFTGDVSASLATLKIALDVVETNEPINRASGRIEQADLEARNAADFRRAIQFLTAGGRVLDDATVEERKGEEWETVVGDIKRGSEIIGRAVVMDGDGKAMVYVGASGNQRVTFISPVDGARRAAMWSEDDAGEMVDWLLENLQAAEAAEAVAAAAIAAAAAPAPAETVATGGGEPPAEPPAAPPVADEPKEPASLGEGRAALAEIAGFMPVFQRKFIESAMRGEEGQYFIDKMIELRDLIVGMPKVYEQDGKGGAAVVYLHFFKGGADWWITERDFELADQQQAFGMADLGHGPELGYISIEEITAAGAELDLHWGQKTIGEIRGDDAADEPAEDEDANIGRTWRSPEGVKEVIGWKDGKYQITIDGERPGLPIDGDDLEQEIRADQKAVEEAEQATIEARRESNLQAGKAVLAALVANHGWTMEAAGFAAKVIGGGVTGGMVNPDGDRRVIATVNFPVVTVKHGDTGLVSRLISIGEEPAAVAADVDAKVNAQDPRHNAVRPLQPQAPDRVQWEQDLVREMGEKLEVDSGDAQAMMEARPDDIDAAFARGDSPATVVAALWPAEQQPATETAPAADPAKDGDRAYLQTLIDGSADYFDTGILDRLEPMFAKYEGDAEMQDLLTRAADAYSNAAAAAAKQALAG